MRRRVEQRGYVQVYTGNGKGKTTAALGLALRAAGAGFRVFFGQFIKGGDYSEIKGLARFAECITVEQFGLGRFIKGEPAPEDVAVARQGLAKMKEVVASGDYGLVVLDEANVAVRCGLFSVQELLAVIGGRAPVTEVVITGRDASPEIIAHADLVTEMMEIKHYFQAGVAARTGIEK